MLGLYLHVPFCEAICSYCNFNRGLFDADLKRRYVQALQTEIRAAGDQRPVDSIFFGGGTPSLLDPADVSSLIATCREAYAVEAGAEVTLEANPESVTSARAEAFLAAGVTRMSLGVQSLHDVELQRLGRLHTAAGAVQAVRAVRAAGLENVSLDLMVWLPGQSRASWRETLHRAIDLAPDHLSFYLLELYPNAPLKEAIARESTGDAAWAQTTDDEAADMYLDGLALVERAGFVQYEISNVARPGRESRHNLKYWTAGDWRGFGCGAHSTVDEVRWQNVSATDAYVDRIDRGLEVALGRRRLSGAERAGEAVFTGLRLTAGVDTGAVEARFGVDPIMGRTAELADCIQEGLLWRSGPRLGLTTRGMLVSNEIMALFV